MFNYNEKTVVNKPFKLNELFKLMKADKCIKADAENINSVILSHVLSPSSTNLEPNENVKEIYIMQVNVNKKYIPEKFIEALNKQILFQTLFKVCYNKEVKYICSIKDFSQEQMKVLKTFVTDWQNETSNEFPTTSKLEVVFKTIISNITGYSFRLNETETEYVERITLIKKQKNEIDKLTRMLNAEKQPNIRMNMNDKIKQLSKELQKMEV